MKDIPNYLTFTRLALIPIFVFLMTDPSEVQRYLAIAVFIIAAVTDYLDGIIARQFSAVSDIGKLLDPMADKLLVVAALVMLLAQRDDLYGNPWVPGWMVFLVIAREIWVTGLRGLAASHGLVVAANSAGKWKSALQMVAIVLLLIHSWKFHVFGVLLTAQVLGLYILLFSLVLSLWGAFEYTWQVLGLFLGRGDGQETKESSSSPEGQF